MDNKSLSYISSLSSFFERISEFSWKLMFVPAREVVQTMHKTNNVYDNHAPPTIQYCLQYMDVLVIQYLIYERAFHHF